MSQGLRTIQPHDLAAELETELFPRLAELLRSRGRGHCMRLTDLDRDLMVRLCSRLRAEVPEARVVILGNGHSATPPTLTVTSTKLVELRNPAADGALRPPLLAFIPTDFRAPAEDSFGIATFGRARGAVASSSSAFGLPVAPFANGCQNSQKASKVSVGL